MTRVMRAVTISVSRVEEIYLEIIEGTRKGGTVKRVTCDDMIYW